MTNKLKDIFSNKDVEMGGKVHFETAEAYKQFLKALELVWEEGKTVEVEGVSAISTQMKTGQSAYPFVEEERVDKMVVAPSTEIISIPLETEIGNKEIQFRKYHTANDTILETASKAIVYMKMRVKNGTTQNTFSYRVQPDFAKSIEEIVESYIVVLAFLEYLFKEDVSGTKEELEVISKTKKYFRGALDFYKRVRQIEQAFNLQFQPQVQNEKKNDEKEFEELYGLLIENLVFRLNAKLTAKEGINIDGKLNESKLKIGSKLDLTFKGDLEYDIYGQTIKLFSANLLLNAAVEEIKEENGNTKIFYSDTDSEPMFISYTAFKSEEERDHELEKIMQYKEKYSKAITVEEYLRKKYLG